MESSVHLRNLLSLLLLYCTYLAPDDGMGGIGFRGNTLFGLLFYRVWGSPSCVFIGYPNPKGLGSPRFVWSRAF